MLIVCCLFASVVTAALVAEELLDNNSAHLPFSGQWRFSDFVVYKAQHQRHQLILIYKISILPLGCNFENGICDYTSLKSAFNWFTTNQKIGIGSIGIQSAHDGTGHYVTTNVNSISVHTGDHASLASPLINDTDICLEFWYNMPSRDSNLQVAINKSNHLVPIWSFNGSAGSNWNKNQLSIHSDQPFQIYFSSTKKGFLSHVGLDDIAISSVTTDTHNETTTTTTTLTAPTPAVPTTTTTSITTLPTANTMPTTTGPTNTPTTTTLPISTASPTTTTTAATETSIENAVNVKCLESSWFIRLDRNALQSLYPNFNDSDVYLGVHSCHGNRSEQELIFQEPYTACGTLMTDSNVEVVYSNTLVYALHDPVFHFIVREFRFKQNIECHMSKGEEVENNINNDHLIKNINAHTTNGSGHFSIQLRFFNDSAFINEFNTTTLSYLIGDKVYVKAQTNIHDYEIKMRLSDCYTKPSKQASDVYIYYLIKDGCATDPNAGILSRTTHETRFYFQQFEYADHPDSMFVHCNARFCKADDYSRACEPVCTR